MIISSVKSIVIIILVPLFIFSCKKEKKKEPDIYISYIERTGLHSTIAKYAKNKTTFSLSDGNYEAITSGIIVNGDDVYVSGTDYDGTTKNALYWKNGFPNFVSSSPYESAANAIDIDNNTVYTAGYDENNAGIIIAKYWKNNTAYSLSNGIYLAIAYDIKYANNNLHIVGQKKNASFISKATYWKMA